MKIRSHKAALITLLLVLVSSPALSQFINYRDSTGAQILDMVDLAADRSNIATATRLNKAYFDSKVGAALAAFMAAVENRSLNTEDFSTWALAKAEAVTDTATLLVSNRISITSNDTISGVSALVVNATGRFSLTDTLYINVPFFAQAGQNIFEFSGNGAIKFGRQAIYVVYPEWFGGVADNSTDNQTAIQKAIESIFLIGDTNEGGSNIAGGVVQLLEGVYRVGGPVFVPGHVELAGLGRFTTGIRSIGTGDHVVIHNQDLTGGASPDTALAQNYVTLRDMYIIGKDYTASPTKPTLQLGGSFVRVERVNVEGGRFNLMFSSGSYHTYEDVDFLGADSANVFMPDSLNGVEVSNIQTRFNYCRFLTSNAYGMLLEGDFNQSGGGGGNRFFIDNGEFSQIESIGIFADHFGELFVHDTDVSASDAHTGFKIWNSWKPRITGCEAEMGSNANRVSINGEDVLIGFHFLDQVAGFMAHNVASVSDHPGVGLLLQSSSECRIGPNTFQGDSIGVWIRETSNHNQITDVVVSNVDPVTGGFCFLEEGSNYNDVRGFYAKHLEDADITPVSPSRNSNWDGWISGSTGGTLRVPWTSNSSYGRITPLPDGDTTPEVTEGTIYKTANTSSTTYTDFDGVVSWGKRITIIINDSNTNFDVTGSSLIHNVGSDFSADSTDVIEFVEHFGKWICTQSDTL